MRADELSVLAQCRMNNERLICGTLHLERPQELSGNDAFLKYLYKYLEIDYPKFYKMDTLSKAGFLAAEFIEREYPFKTKNTPLVLANRTGSASADHAHSTNLYLDHPSPSPATFVYTLPNIAMGEISIRHQLHSENVFFIFDAFDPTFTTPIEQHYLLSDKADYVLGGWLEANTTDLDIFLYLVGKQGIQRHTAEHLTTLYNSL